jgi:hypothetical protein
MIRVRLVYGIHWVLARMSGEWNRRMRSSNARFVHRVRKEGVHVVPLYGENRGPALERKTVKYRLHGNSRTLLAFATSIAVVVGITALPPGRLDHPIPQS